MIIGLLTTELKDIEVKNICIGAGQAARDKGVNLVILPGKKLFADNSADDRTFDYQYSALFDYACEADFDALIVDIERIGSKTTILKREAFLKKFEKTPLLTLSEYEGYISVNDPKTENDQYQQLGYEAVCDAVFYAENKILPPVESKQQFNFEELPDSHALSVLSDMSYQLMHNKYDDDEAYGIFSKTALKHGVNYSGILLYEKNVRNTLKYPWSRPENIAIMSAVIEGKELEKKEEKPVIETGKIISTFAKNKGKCFIMGPLFVGEYQLGVMISEFVPGLLSDNYFDNVISLVTGVSRISYLEKELVKTTSELYEVQEELAKDDSVLDHIGDQDYLTGGLNRRGFFAEAYDLLKDNFIPGRYAVVAYIYMENLKLINDMFGHEEGDRAVKKIAGILEGVFGDSIYGRIRGNEFAVIMISDEEGKAESLRESMSEQNAKLLAETTRYINNLQYSICEFGYEENLSLREMLKETDENLQRIKGNS